MEKKDEFILKGKKFKALKFVCHDYDEIKDEIGAEEFSSFSVLRIPYLINEKKVDNPNVIVINHKELHIILGYPLRKTIVKTFEKLISGFSREDVLWCIYRAYKEIYAEEEGKILTHDFHHYITSKSYDINNILKNKGKHGIWGHIINDLFVEGIEKVIYKPNYIYIVVGS